MPHERDLAVERHLAMAAGRSHAARADLRVATFDLFLPFERRLTDQQRALANDILHKLIGALEVELRQQLVAVADTRPEFRAVSTILANGNTELARPVLEASAVLQDVELVSALIRRAEEHRLALAIKNSGGQPQPDPLDALACNPDAALARSATEYAVAESRRYDGFREPVLSRNDMHVELAYSLSWRVAAALRTSLLRDHRLEAPLVDNLLEQSVRRSMADHTEAHGAVARALRVAQRLNDLGRLTDDLLGQLIQHGHVVLFVASLAVRGGIAYDIAWQALTDPPRMSLAVLLRALDMERPIASTVTRVLEDAGAAVTRSPAALAAFDELHAAQAQVVLRYWQLDTGYRAAIDALGDSRF